jgi:hypothetical protein
MTPKSSERPSAISDLYHGGTLDEERYQLWEIRAVRIVACKGIQDGELLVRVPMSKRNGVRAVAR